MSIRFETAAKYQNRIVERIKADFRQAIQFHLTHKWILESLTEHWKSEAYKKLPAWRKAYINGIESCLFAQLHECIYIAPQKTRPALLEWVLTSPSTGKHYRDKDDSWLRECSDLEKPNMIGNHVWREAMNLGEWKPF